MRMLERNMRDMWLSRHETVELTDDGGRGTAEYVSRWSGPTHLMANHSAPSGDSSASPFGTAVDYDLSVMLANNALGIAEGDVMWAFHEPGTADDGQPSMAGAYDVTRVAEGINYVAVALKRREGR